MHRLRRRLAAEAGAIGTYVEIDMEQAGYVADTIDIYKHLQKDFDGLRLAMQVYLRRTPGISRTCPTSLPRFGS